MWRGGDVDALYKLHHSFLLNLNCFLNITSLVFKQIRTKCNITKSSTYWYKEIKICVVKVNCCGGS